MLTNPFTPIFGGKPDFFFGRKDILSRFETALIDRGSDYRALFITGTRGYGKTALLEQLSQRAGAAGWRVIDLGSDSPIENIVRQLAGSSELTKSIDPSIGVTVLGFGASAGGYSSSKTVRFDRADVGPLVLEACRSSGRGLVITIDEIQKVALDDVAAICDAFQMASRKGLNAMLIVAGLPFAHRDIIHHEGCTYLRRAAHEAIAPLTRDEVSEGLRGAFARAGIAEVEREALTMMVNSSKGHPYILQLIGYFLVAECVAQDRGESVAVGVDDASLAISRALDAYATRAVAPMVEVLPRTEVDYLRAMSAVLDDTRVARTADIAQELGKTQQQLSMPRRHLIDEGIVIAARRGELIFGIPYLDDYLLRRDEVSDEVRSREAWGY